MVGRFALVIGNDDYQDANLARLKTPSHDVSDLADVLRSPEIGGFDQVVTLFNEPESAATRAIERFFKAQRSPDDLLVMYFSGHGVRAPSGRLYLAVTDTAVDALDSTAISAAFVTAMMDGSRSRRKVLILDCCHSGAFEQGTKAVAGASVGTALAFEGAGYGHVVLTASDALQYAWEGDRVIGDAQNSLFTHFLVQGLKTGEADRDTDGWIALDELYDYVFEHVASATPNQRPHKWSYRQQGEMIIAQAPRRALRPAALPADLQETLEDPRPWVREGALRELERLLRSQRLDLQSAARSALERLGQDDSRRVAEAAAASLAAFAAQPAAADLPGPAEPEGAAPALAPVAAASSAATEPQPARSAFLAPQSPVNLSQPTDAAGQPRPVSLVDLARGALDYLRERPALAASLDWLPGLPALVMYDQNAFLLAAASMILGPAGLGLAWRAMDHAVRMRQLVGLVMGWLLSAEVCGALILAATLAMYAINPNLVDNREAVSLFYLAVFVIGGTIALAMTRRLMLSTGPDPTPRARWKRLAHGLLTWLLPALVSWAIIGAAAPTYPAGELGLLVFTNLAVVGLISSPLAVRELRQARHAPT